MKIQTLILSLPFFAAVLLFAENQSITTWQVTTGGELSEMPNDTLPTKDGGFIVTGSTSSFNSNPGSVQAWLVKFDSIGKLEWQRRLGSKDKSSFGNALLQTKDGGYVVTGQLNYHLWVARLDSFGNIQWQKTYGSGSESGAAIHQTSDSGFIVAGSTTTFTRNYDIWLLKLDRRGRLQWEKTFGTADYDYVHSLHPAKNGGYTLTCDLNDRFAVLHLDGAGNIRWRRTFDGLHFGFGESTDDDGLLISGADFSRSASDWNLWMMKMNSHGNVEWQKSYGSDGSDESSFSNGVQTDDGGFVLTGHLDWNLANFFLLKLNRLGEIEWQKNYKTDHSDIPRLLRIAKDGGFVISGERYLFRREPPDFWLFKASPLGDVSEKCSVEINRRTFKLRDNPAIASKISLTISTHHDPVVTIPTIRGIRTHASSRRSCLAVQEVSPVASPAE